MNVKRWLIDKNVLLVPLKCNLTQTHGVLNLNYFPTISPHFPEQWKKLNFLQKLYLKRNKSRQKVKRRENKKRRNNFSSFLFILFDEVIRKIASPIVFHCVLWSEHWWTGEIMPLKGTEAQNDLKLQIEIDSV